MLACQDQDVVLSGALCLPRGTDLKAVAAIDCDSGELFALDISPPHHGSADRLWFVPADVYDARLKVEIQARRQTLGIAIGGRTSADSNLNLAVIPSTFDLQNFKFAGAERARRVAGSADTLHLFAAGGLTQATQILKITETLPLPADARVLDWGCGAGRVGQFVATSKPGWRLSGADIDEVNIDWCKAHLSDQAEFHLIGLMPPTPYEAGEFDFIYGLSVITHLERAARDAWIAELARILKPQGHALLTYMGVWAALQCGRHDAAMDVYASLASRGVSDDLRDYALGEELSSYYKATYNTRAELLSVVEIHFEVVAEYPRSLCYQDAILVRRR